ncbi:MAG: cytochrome C biogenesis protein CcmC [Nitrospirales bacterium]|nr:MAG: cytochrome C biogenesis protein CcmC [Nitrospirales bacterium]
MPNMINRIIRQIQRYKGWFGGGAALCIFLGLYIGLLASPPDYYQGELVRIMYVHVPLAHTSTLAYSVLFFGSIWYLWKRDPLVDNMCQASASICALFTALALITGSIWAKPTWNTWWTWDPRLVSFTVLLLILGGYIMLRRLVDDRVQGGRYAAILAIVGGIDLPIIKFSVEWWRTLHQPMSFSTRGVSISEDILVPLTLMSIGCWLLFAYMVMVRTQILYLTDLLHAKKGRFLSQTHFSQTTS